MSSLVTSFVIYFVVVAGIAVYAGIRTKTITDYVIGNRQLSPTVSALSAGASDMSGWLLLGLPGAIYIAGIVESWIVVGLVIGAWLNWTFVAPRLRRASVAFERNADTLPSFFAERTGWHHPALGILTSLAIIFFFAVYVATGFVASGKLFESVLGMSYSYAVLIGAVVIVLYTVIGGFLAVSWTDAFQATLMLVALLLVPALAAFGASSANDVNLDLSGMFNVEVLALIGLLAWGLGYFGQPHILARFMAIQEADAIPRARAIGMTWMILVSIGAVAVGLAGAAVFEELEDRETVFIALTDFVLNPWIAGAIIAAILAAVMSTVDSQLVVSSAAVIRDMFKMQNDNILGTRAVVVVIAVAALLLALDPDNTIFGLVTYAWAGLGASFGPAVLFCLFWRRTTGLSVTVAVIVGSVVTVGWHHASGGLFDLYEIVPAFIAASVAVVVVSLVRPSAEAEERFDRFTRGSSL